MNKEVDLNFDGFKYLKEVQEQNILIEERNISINSFTEEIDSCEYLVLCVESRIFNSDDLMSGGHYIILNGRDGENIRVINPIKEKYEIKILNINFLIKACRDYGAWRILVREEKMIKVIAFDLVGVLVNEKDIDLSEVEDKLERMFGPNLNDADYLIEARKIIEKDSMIMNITETLIDKLYKVKDKEIFKKVKEKNENVKIIIATNHLSFVRNFIGESFNVEYLDDLIISAEIHKIKPNPDFYEYILNKYNINSKELLFLDDNIANVNEAKKLGINTIKVEKNTDLIEEISKYID